MPEATTDELRAVVPPGRTALLIIELQNGTVGDEAPPGLEELVDAVRVKNVVPNTAKVLHAARTVGVDVFHSLTFRRRDYKGSQTSDRLLRAFNTGGHGPFRGTRAADAIAEVAPVEGDFELWRSHCSTSFHDTGLDSLLRNMGISTIILTGDSLNFNVFGTAMDATNRNYKVVVPADCVAGWPLEYGEMVIRHSLALRTFITTADQLVEAWSGAA